MKKSAASCLAVVVLLNASSIAPVEKLSPDEEQMKERLTRISQGSEPVGTLRIEFYWRPSHRSGPLIRFIDYFIANGTITREYYGPWKKGSEPQDYQRAMAPVSDERVRQLLRDLIDQMYWEFKKDLCSSDEVSLVFRFSFNDRSEPVEYSRQSPKHLPEGPCHTSRIVSTFLKFVDDEFKAQTSN